METPKQGRESAEKLTSELAGEVVFNSFRYSQGSKNLQLLLMKAAVSLRPGWKPSSEILDFLDSDEYFERLFKFVTSSTHALGTAAPFQADTAKDPKEARGGIRLAYVKDGLVPFNDALRERKPFTEQDCLDLVKWMVERDVQFMQLRHKNSDWKPRETSQFIDLVIEGGKAQGPKVYEEIFSLVRNTLKTSRITADKYGNIRAMLNNILELLEWHNARNPDQKVDLSDHLSAELFTAAVEVAKVRAEKKTARPKSQ